MTSLIFKGIRNVLYLKKYMFFKKKLVFYHKSIAILNIHDYNSEKV